MENSQDEKQPNLSVEIPIESLSPQALSGIIDEFISREGTDYGVHEASHEDKVTQIRLQLKKSQIKIVFDPLTESVTMITLREWKLQNKQ